MIIVSLFKLGAEGGKSVKSEVIKRGVCWPLWRKWGSSPLVDSLPCGMGLNQIQGSGAAPRGESNIQNL